MSVTVDKAAGGGVTVRFAETELPFVVAEMATVLLAATVPAVTVNVAAV